MAGPRLFDRVKDTTTTTGTGTITLANSAPTGYRTFGSVLSNSDTTLYAIIHQSADEWEVGLGTYTSSGTTLARTTVIASTNSNAAVNFSAGTKDVFQTLPADFATQFLNPTAAYASLAAFQAGRVLWPTNGFTLFRDSGSALVPWGPVHAFTPPVNSDFAWINQGTSTVTEDKGAIYFEAQAALSTLRVRKKSKTGTYTVTAAFMPSLIGAAARCGLLWRQSSDGKIVAFLYQHNPSLSGINVASVYKWSSATTFSASYVEVPFYNQGPLIWQRLQDNGTNRKCFVSGDGQNWQQIHSVGRTDYMTADEVGICLDPAQATYVGGLTLLHWAEA